MFMHTMKLFGATLILYGLSLGYGQTPVPARPLGYHLTQWPEQPPKVVVEAFYDHLCSDSKANWPVLKEVVSQMQGKEVTFILHIFPLPYHHNAYFAQEVGVVVRQMKPDRFADFVQLIFDHQDSFLTGAVNMTEPEVQSSLAKLTSDALDVNMESIQSGFSDEVVVEKSRYAWKYAASRGITGTPRFLVNGVGVTDVGNDATAWTSYILKLLSAPY